MLRIITSLIILGAVLAFKISGNIAYRESSNSLLFSSFQRKSVSRNNHGHLSSLILSSSDKPPSALSSMFSNKRSDTKFSIDNTNRVFTRCAWISWWTQIVLSVISGVILTFANTVRRGGNTFSFWSSGFALSTIGVVISFFNCAWTWNVTRLTRRVSSRSIDDIKIIPTLRKYFRVSVVISLLGMLASLLGAEQIVGVLASKVLNAQGFGSTLITTINAQNSLQALDIFLVQANTNALVAHFAPLLCFLFAQTLLPQRDIIETNDSKPEGPPPVAEDNNEGK